VSKRKAPKLSGQILDEATTWFVEFGEGELSQSAREEFIRWLRTSPEHVRAYLQITAHWEDARALKESQTRTIEELIGLGARRGQCHCPRFRSAAAIRSRCFRRNCGFIDRCFQTCGCSFAFSTYC